MPDRYPQPPLHVVAAALERHGLPHECIEVLGDGWDFWAFAAGDLVLRTPKNDLVGDVAFAQPVAEKLATEARLLGELAPLLPLAIPEPVRLADDGPNGMPFCVYRRVPGVPLRDFHGRLAPGFGASLGCFLRALHSFPVERAVALGLNVMEGHVLRRRLIKEYEDYVRRVFPLISCEARTHAQEVFESRVNDPAFFDFEPRMSHRDIDERHLLIDPVSGKLRGVIDFGDAAIGPRASDFVWAYCLGFERFGIAGQIRDLLREGELDEAELAGQREFVSVWWPLADIDHALDVGDEDAVREGIVALNAV